MRTDDVIRNADAKNPSESGIGNPMADTGVGNPIAVDWYIGRSLKNLSVWCDTSDAYDAGLWTLTLIENRETGSY